MSNGKRVISMLLIVGAAGAHMVCAQAQIDLSAKSTWELCKAVQGGADALSDEAARELERRGADCGFIKSNSGDNEPSVESSLYEREPFFELEVDLNKRVQPR